MINFKKGFKMKPLHLYEIKMIDGSSYRGEIAYRDERMLVLRLKNRLNQNDACPKVRLFYNGIITGLAKENLR